MIPPLAHSFALEEPLQGDPGLEVEIERLATHSHHWVLPSLGGPMANGDGDVGAIDGVLEPIHTKADSRGEETHTLTIPWKESLPVTLEWISSHCSRSPGSAGRSRNGCVSPLRWVSTVESQYTSPTRATTPIGRNSSGPTPK